jgi:hypothetical protein
MRTAQTAAAPRTCPACETELPREASYCFRCGAALRGVEGTPAMLETCEIALWHGYLSGCFFALPGLGTTGPEPPAKSPAFPQLGDGVPQEGGAALGALTALLERLKNDGWETVAEGPLWYERRLLRRTGVAARARDAAD